MKKRNSLIVFLCVAALACHAQKIDFDMTGRQTSEVTEAGYQSWQVRQGLSAMSTFSVNETSGIEVEINCGDGEPENRCLRASWSKNIVQRDSKLVGDAIAVKGLDSDNNTPHLTDESATMNFTFRGLSAGEHSLLTYLNVTDGGMTSIAPVDVLVDGQTMFTGVMMSNQATLPSASGQVYITFTVEEGRDVKVSFVSKPEPGITYSTSGIYVCAMVLDRPNPKTTALDPFPSNLDMHVAADDGTLDLSWTQATSAVKNIVYMGTSETDMKLLEETVLPVCHVEGLSTHNVYYWRVDQCDADGKVYMGDTWTFRPRRLAFPGAEGYGRYAIGGRGGSVYHVISLDDYAPDEAPIPGTFRYGIREVSGPRTIVFDVAGTIILKARLTCSEPYVTVAGQTAPGKGVLFRGAPFGMAGDGITRFMRLRLGYHNGDTSKGLDGMGMAGNNFSIMDHCSIGWTIDEAFSSRNAKNITLQRTLISEALNVADHPNYAAGKAHGYAATIGGDTGSYHHNLLAHNAGRNWSMSGGLDGRGFYAGHHDMFNNVCYNWDGRTTDGGTHEGQFVNNYYKMGPSSNNKFLLTAQLEGTGSGSQTYYVNGNIRENKDHTLTEDAYGVTYNYQKAESQELNWDVFVDKPFFESYANIESAKLAFKTVLSDVGANQPYFDEHDVRMVYETFTGKAEFKGCKTGKSGLIDRETDSEGFDYFYAIGETRSADFDSDQDGMPDWWERLKGLNPTVADNNDYSEANGYTALEEYLNWIAEPNFRVVAGMENTVVNLRTLFAGFKDDVYYNIVGVPNGYIVEERRGELIVTPPANVDELITIQIVAGDEDEVGYMTRDINMCVTSDATGIDIPVNIDPDKYVHYRLYSVNGILMNRNDGVSSLPPGVYILKSINRETSRSVKIIRK